MGWLHAHWDGGEAVNDVTPSIDEAVPSGHVVHAPQLTGQSVMPVFASASEHEGANSLRPQEDVQPMVDAEA